MHIKVSEASDALRLLFQNKKQVFFHTCAANNDLRLFCSGAKDDVLGSRQERCQGFGANEDRA